MQAKQKDETEALRAAISHAGRTGKTAPLKSVSACG